MFQVKFGEVFEFGYFFQSAVGDLGTAQFQPGYLFSDGQKQRDVLVAEFRRIYSTYFYQVLVLR
ncbi:hypothetical protein D3C86_1868160 [compost metagenome]